MIAFGVFKKLEIFLFDNLNAYYYYQPQLLEAK